MTTQRFVSNTNAILKVITKNCKLEIKRLSKSGAIDISKLDMRDYLIAKAIVKVALENTFPSFKEIKEFEEAVKNLRKF